LFKLPREERERLNASIRWSGFRLEKAYPMELGRYEAAPRGGAALAVNPDIPLDEPFGALDSSPVC
jgi:hypothetical protein